MKTSMTALFHRLLIWLRSPTPTRRYRVTPRHNASRLPPRAAPGCDARIEARPRVWHAPRAPALVEPQLHDR